MESADAESDVILGATHRAPGSARIDLRWGAVPLATGVTTAAFLEDFWNGAAIAHADALDFGRALLRRLLGHPKLRDRWEKIASPPLVGRATHASAPGESGRCGASRRQSGIGSSAMVTGTSYPCWDRPGAAQELSVAASAHVELHSMDAGEHLKLRRARQRYRRGRENLPAKLGARISTKMDTSKPHGRNP